MQSLPLPLYFFSHPIHAEFSKYKVFSTISFITSIVTFSHSKIKKVFFFDKFSERFFKTNI